MNWDVTHSCGHTESHLIVAAFAYQAETRALQLKRRKCTTCYRADKDAKATDQAAADGATLAEVSHPYASRAACSPSSPAAAASVR